MLPPQRLSPHIQANVSNAKLIGWPIHGTLRGASAAKLLFDRILRGRLTKSHAARRRHLRTAYARRCEPPLNADATRRWLMDN